MEKYHISFFHQMSLSKNHPFDIEGKTRGPCLSEFILLKALFCLYLVSAYPRFVPLTLK